MTNGQPKDHNDVSSSTASTFAEKRKEYNKRYYASHKENNKVLKVCTVDISRSDSSIERTLQRPLQPDSSQMTQMTRKNVSLTPTEKRKERNRRYYASHKENNKVLKVCTVDISRSDSSIERTLRRPLQPDSSQMTQMPRNNVSLTPTEKRKERNRRYYARCKANGKRISNGNQMTQMPKENVSCTSTEKRKEYNKDRMFQFTVSNGHPKDSDDVSSSIASTLAEKRKEYNKRYYASRKENNKALKVCNGDISRSDSSIERIPRRTLQTDGSQMTQMPKENLSLPSTEERKYGSQVTKPQTDDNTPTTTLSVIETVMPETSEGVKMINSEINTTEIGTNVPGPTTVHKKPLLAAKKVALRDVQNDNSNFTRNAHSQSLISVEGQLFADAPKTCGTKRLTPDYASSPILTNSGAHEHFNYPRRKYEIEGNRQKNVGHPKSGSLTQIQQEAGQISGKNVHYGYLVGQNQMGSKPYVSRFKESNDAQWAERFIRLQKFIKQCDGSDHRENIQLLVRLSPLELSKHAVELEKRAIQLTIEEGKEMQRMQTLNILGKPSINKIPYSNYTTQELKSKAANR